MHVTWRCWINVVENPKDSSNNDKISCEDADFEVSTDFYNSKLTWPL